MDVYRYMFLTLCAVCLLEARHLDLLKKQEIVHQQNGVRNASQISRQTNNQQQIQPALLTSRQVNNPPRRVQMNTQNIIQQRNIMRPGNQGTGNNLGKPRVMNSGNNQMPIRNSMNRQVLPNTINQQQNGQQINTGPMQQNVVRNRNFNNGNVQVQNLNGGNMANNGNMQVQNLNGGNRVNNGNMLNQNRRNGINVVQNGRINTHVQQLNGNNRIISGQGQLNTGNRNQGLVNVRSNMALASGPGIVGNLRNTQNNMNLRPKAMMSNGNNNGGNGLINNMMNNNQNNRNMAIINNQNNRNMAAISNQNNRNGRPNNIVGNQNPINRFNNINNQNNLARKQMNNAQRSMNNMGGFQNIVSNAVNRQQFRQNNQNGAGNGNGNNGGTGSAGNGNGNIGGTGGSKQIKITIKRTQQENTNNQVLTTNNNNHFSNTVPINSHSRLGGQRFGQTNNGRGMWKNVPVINSPVSQLLPRNTGLPSGRSFLPVGTLSGSIGSGTSSIIRPGNEPLLNTMKNPTPIADVLNGMWKGPLISSSTSSSSVSSSNGGLPSKAVPPGKKIAYQLQLKSKDGKTKSITILGNAEKSNNSNIPATAITEPQVTYLNNTSTNTRKKKMSLTLMSSHTGGRPIVIETLGQIVLSQQNLPNGRTQFVINADPPAPMPFNEEMEVEAEELATKLPLPSTFSNLKNLVTTRATV